MIRGKQRLCHRKCCKCIGLLVIVHVIFAYVTIRHTQKHHKNSLKSLDTRNSAQEAKHSSDSAAKSSSSVSTKIILFAYMRTGSTLTSQIFSRDLNTFYLFEPVMGIYSYLYGINHVTIPTNLLYYRNGTKR